MNRPLLELDSVCKDYALPAGLLAGAAKRSVRVLDDVTFRLDRQETLGLVGESGSGKSTTGRVILRLTPATSGLVRFDGTDILDLKPAAFRPYKAAMQMIFQDPRGSLNPAYRVRESIDEAMRIHHPKLEAAERRERAAELLRQVGLDPNSGGRLPYEFSGGQLQRIAIARALAVNPRLIVADEAVSALDVSVQAQVLNLMSDLKDRLGLSFLFIAHDLAVVKRMSQRVAVMYRGRIVETASSEDIHRRPAHPYTRTLLEAIPRMRGSQPHAEGPAPTGEPVLTGARPGVCAFVDRCPISLPLCRESRPQTRVIDRDHSVACHRA